MNGIDMTVPQDSIVSPPSATAPAGPMLEGKAGGFYLLLLLANGEPRGLPGATPRLDGGAGLTAGGAECRGEFGVLQHAVADVDDVAMWTSRSISAPAITSSPKTSPQSSKPFYW